MSRTLLLGSLLAAATALAPTPAAACSENDPLPSAGLLHDSVSDPPANTAFFFHTDSSSQQTQVLVRDRSDGHPLSGTRTLYSEAARASLFVLDEPMQPGHDYETLEDPPTRFTATEPAVENPAKPSVVRVRVHDVGGGCPGYGCGEETISTLEGFVDLPPDVAFLVIRYADTEAAAYEAERIDTFTNSYVMPAGPHTGYAAISAVDHAGHETERVVVAVEDETGEGCRIMPRSSGAQLYGLLALSAFFLRRRPWSSRAARAASRQRS
jgi:hypothetical protein